MNWQVICSRRASRLVFWLMMGLLIGYSAVLWYIHGRISPEAFRDAVQPIWTLLGGTIGVGLNWLFYDQLESLRTRYRKRLRGTFLGYDVTKVFTRKP